MLVRGVINVWCTTCCARWGCAARHQCLDCIARFKLVVARSLRRRTGHTAVFARGAALATTSLFLCFVDLSVTLANTPHPPQITQLSLQARAPSAPLSALSIHKYLKQTVDTSLPFVSAYSSMLEILFSSARLHALRTALSSA